MSLTLFCHRQHNLRLLALQKDAADFVLFDAEDLEEKDTPESIFYGRVQRVLGAFALIDIGLDRPGVLNNPLHLNEGDTFFVQIKRQSTPDAGEAAKGLLKKGAQLSLKIALITPYFMYFPSQKGVSLSSSIEPEDGHFLLKDVESFIQNKDFGKIILRTKALSCDADFIFNALIKTHEEWFSLSQNPTVGLIKKGRTQLEILIDTYAPDAVYTDHIDDFHQASKAFAFILQTPPVHYKQSDVFELSGAYEALADMMTPWISLPSGGQLLIEYTSTLVSIDVNQGTCSSLKILNEEAAKMIPTLFQTLQLGGNMIVDFAGNNDFRKRKKLLGILKPHLPKDVEICEWSPLGWLEIRRPKKRPYLKDILGPFLKY